MVSVGGVTTVVTTTGCCYEWVSDDETHVAEPVETYEFAVY